mmetsp:Transcript_22640/g.55949  ORF Transcript_22640/g.55949 Transcript_22640/m.55949 type:complete len:235 (+) Transcript_22640:379-1083(+)
MHIAHKHRTAQGSPRLAPWTQHNRRPVPWADTPVSQRVGRVLPTAGLPAIRFESAAPDTTSSLPQGPAHTAPPRARPPHHPRLHGSRLLGVSRWLLCGVPQRAYSHARAALALLCTLRRLIVVVVAVVIVIVLVVTVVVVCFQRPLQHHPRLDHLRLRLGVDGRLTRAVAVAHGRQHHLVELRQQLVLHLEVSLQLRLQLVLEGQDGRHLARRCARVAAELLLLRGHHLLHLGL